MGPGLELWQLDMTDADALFAVADRNRARLRKWLPWVDRTRSAEDVRTFIAGAREQWEAGLGPNAAIRLEGSIVGAAGAHRYDLEHRNCSIGYWLDAACEGRGIVTRCAGALVDYLFRVAKLHRVEIRCGTGNARSCAVPQRLGFRREGVLRDAQWVNDHWVDLVVWGMLEDEWLEDRRRNIE